MIINAFPKQTYYNKYVYVHIKLQQMLVPKHFKIFKYLILVS